MSVTVTFLLQSVYCLICLFFPHLTLFFFFFFNDTATTEIYTLSLHDALPILPTAAWSIAASATMTLTHCSVVCPADTPRSEEHTSELQSQSNLVCRLLLEKKKKKQKEQRAMYHTLNEKKERQGRNARSTGHVD